MELEVCERERSIKTALKRVQNPDFWELMPVDQPDGVPLSRTRVRWDHREDDDM